LKKTAYQFEEDSNQRTGDVKSAGACTSAVDAWSIIY